MASLPKYKCGNCGKEYPTREQLWRHRRAHAAYKHPCSVCGKLFRFPSQLKVHQTVHVQEQEKKFNCKFCEKKFPNMGYLREHAKKHADFLFTCQECGKGFHYKQPYQEHVAVQHEGKRYECKICNKIFNNYSYFITHSKQHDPLQTVKKRPRRIEKEVICDMCGKTLRSKAGLLKHIRMHKGDKPYMCTICGNKFTCLSNLKIHDRIHNNEKPYLCKQCGKSFRQSISLNIHTRYHTGERPYSCEICDKDFVSRSGLNIHMKTHQRT